MEAGVGQRLGDAGYVGGGRSGRVELNLALGAPIQLNFLILLTYIG